MVKRYKHICYTLFSLMVFLLLLYAVFALRGSALGRGIAAANPESAAVPVLRLTTLTGLLAGGLVMTLGHSVGHRPSLHRLLWGTSFAWGVLALFAVLAPLVGVSWGGFGRLQSVVILLFVGLIALHRPQWLPNGAIWAGGLSMYAVLSLIWGDGCYAQGGCSPVAIFVSWLGLYGALTVAACGMGFWLMHRYSHISQAWGSLGVKVMAGWLSIAAVFIALAALPAYENSGLLRFTGVIGLFFVPLAYIVYGSHSYRALSDQNGTRTLSPHWYSLGLMVFMAAGGALGGLNGDMSLRQWLSHPLIVDVRVRVVWFALACVGLAMLNQAVAEMRGENRRITGLMPFWLVAFGFAGGQLVFAIAAAMRITLEGHTALSPALIDMLLMPLYRLWWVGHIIMLAGVLIYGLGFWVRRLRWS